MDKNSNIPWVEKYRPVHFENIVLDPINQQLFQNVLSKNYFPNLLFYGSPGTGKTTTIMNLINEYQTIYYKLNKNLVIHLNASDERGIDIIRNQIYQFIRSKNMFDAGMKFVILDEVDYMTKNAQQALKYLLQTCSHNVRFCLICNYISKIEESLQNEFICVRFNQLPQIEIYKFIRTIAEKEGLHMDQESIETIQTMFQSDIRSMINFIQLNQNMNFLEWDKKIIHRGLLENIHNIIVNVNNNCRNESVEKCKQYICDTSVQYNIDKKSILLKYFHFIIKEKEYSSGLFKIMEEILHNSDVKTEVMLNYFSHKMIDLFAKNVHDNNLFILNSRNKNI
jgi:DNA polymerase III delta prime subunit